MRVDVIETPDLGDRSYVVSDGAVAVVIDPQRDLDRVEALLERLGVVPKMVHPTQVGCLDSWRQSRSTRLYGGHRICAISPEGPPA